MLDFKRDILPLKNIIFRTALRIVLNREEAEDIVQDTLMKLWQRRDELEQVKSLEAFALSSARNLAIDRKERMENRNVSLDDEAHNRPDESSLGSDNH
ncbi:MAG: RNA polymerase subunit sigma-70, partial [Bacteroidaceae bacterium]|nr:RNA polymerase subunit sigma-70 [Bacteroidaceae bacterium]